MLGVVDHEQETHVCARENKHAAKQHFAMQGIPKHHKRVAAKQSNKQHGSPHPHRSKPHFPGQELESLQKEEEIVFRLEQGQVPGPHEIHFPKAAFIFHGLAGTEKGALVA